MKERKRERIPKRNSFWEIRVVKLVGPSLHVGEL